ncbi:hypothetical protein EBS43_02930, partial [bacterium]|nr:hypothetical protein [bacterium]
QDALPASWARALRLLIVLLMLGLFGFFIYFGADLLRKSLFKLWQFKFPDYGLFFLSQRSSSLRTFILDPRATIASQTRQAGTS